MGGRTSRRGRKDLHTGPPSRLLGPGTPGQLGPAQPPLSEAQGFLRNGAPLLSSEAENLGFSHAGLSYSEISGLQLLLWAGVLLARAWDPNAQSSERL